MSGVARNSSHLCVTILITISKVLFCYAWKTCVVSNIFQFSSFSNILWKLRKMNIWISLWMLCRPFCTIITETPGNYHCIVLSPFSGLSYSAKIRVIEWNAVHVMKIMTSFSRSSFDVPLLKHSDDRSQPLLINTRKMESREGTRKSTGAIQKEDHSTAHCCLCGDV